MTDQEREKLAVRLRGHVSTLASTNMELSLAEWNEIASDMLDAADTILNREAIVAALRSST